ncbi:MAG: hypothetical protein U9N11_00950 [Campylobacterota bacterium]|nr:hypothetical protein [Campylobacterota bacterium]
MKNYAIFIIFVFLNVGCTYKYGTYGVISTKNIDFTQTYVQGDNKVTGKDVAKMYIVIPDKIRPMIDDALNDALSKSCAEFLTDAEINMKWWLIPYVYGENTFTVKGYPWYKKGMKDVDCITP